MALNPTNTIEKKIGTITATDKCLLFGIYFLSSPSTITILQKPFLIGSLMIESCWSMQEYPTQHL